MDEEVENHACLEKSVIFLSREIIPKLGRQPIAYLLLACFHCLIWVSRPNPNLLSSSSICCVYIQTWHLGTSRPTPTYCLPPQSAQCLHSNTANYCIHSTNLILILLYNYTISLHLSILGAAELSQNPL